MVKNERAERTTPVIQKVGLNAPAMERPGTVIRTSDTQYKLIDPKTGGTYILKTQSQWTDEQIIKHINFVVRKTGRVQPGETTMMESPK